MKLLITGAWSEANNHIDAITALGHQVIWMQNEKDALPCAYEAVEGVICNGLFLYHPIEKFTSLKFVQLTSAGYDRMPMDYAKSHGIAVYNAKGVYSIPMAEMAICGVLQLYKQSRFFMEHQADQCWEKHRGLLELAGKRVCIVGCGSVGTECAKRFSAFDCHITGVAIRPRPSAYFDAVVDLGSLYAVLPTADIVILAVPYAPETAKLMDAKSFAAMKPGAVLVNLARGQIVDTNSLLEALSGKLLGAVLDVFEEEPLPAAHPLWQKHNVILTPHNSFVGEGNPGRMARLIMKNLEFQR